MVSFSVSEDFGCGSTPELPGIKANSRSLEWKDKKNGLKSRRMRDGSGDILQRGAPGEPKQNDAHMSRQVDKKNRESTINRDTLPECIPLPPSGNSSNADSLRHRSLERTSDGQGARSAEEILSEAENTEADIVAVETDDSKIQDLVTSVSKPVASTQLDKPVTDSSDGDNSLPNAEKFDFDTAWYLWYLSDKPALEGIAGKALLRIAVFLIVFSTYGLVLFAISLQGFLIVPILGPNTFLIVVCVLLLYFEVFVIYGKIIMGYRTVRKEKGKKQGQQNQQKNERGQAPADV
jgi:hypothetical protein